MCNHFFLRNCEIPGQLKESNCLKNGSTSIFWAHITWYLQKYTHRKFEQPTQKHMRLPSRIVSLLNWTEHTLLDPFEKWPYTFSPVLLFFFTFLYICTFHHFIPTVELLTMLCFLISYSKWGYCNGTNIYIILYLL